MKQKRCSRGKVKVVHTGHDCFVLLTQPKTAAILIALVLTIFRTRGFLAAGCTKARQEAQQTRETSIPHPNGRLQRDTCWRPGSNQKRGAIRHQGSSSNSTIVVALRLVTTSHAAHNSTQVWTKCRRTHGKQTKIGREKEQSQRIRRR